MRHTELKSLTELTGKENPKPCPAGNWSDYPSQFCYAETNICSASVAWKTGKISL